MVAYSYIRWSSSIQTKGDSLNRQISKTREFCNSNGWILDESLQPDKGVSAFRGKNITEGPLAQFLEKIENNHIDTPCVLVVEAIDRLTRAHWTEAEKIWRKIIDGGVTIASWQTGKIYSPEFMSKSPMNVMMFLMELEAAHNYSNNLSKRLTSAWRKKKELTMTQGKLLTRKIPAWLTLPETKAKKNPPECFKVISNKAKTVKFIFKRYLEGAGVDTIVQELNGKNAETFSAKSKAWAITSVRRLLRSESVIGKLVFNRYVDGTPHPDGNKIENYYPAVVDKKIFFEAQDELGKRKTHKGSNKKVITIFKGLCKCNKCGWNMVVKCGATSKTDDQLPTWAALVCSQAMRGKGCSYETFRLEDFENAVITAYLPLLLQMWYEPRKTKNLEKLETRKKEITRHLDNYQSSLNESDGQIPKLVLKKITELETELDEMDNKIKNNSEPVDPYDYPYKKILNGEMDPILKNVKNRNLIKNILPTFIDEISINAAKKEAVIFNTWMNRAREKRHSVKIRTTKDLDKVTGDKHFFLNGQPTFFEHDLFWQ
jgi:DNA invertase Pin-like site-specific DNA recombinase